MTSTVEKATIFEILRQLAVALQRLFNPFCEVVIHDFTDLEHSIVCIEGNISNRSIGGAATDLLLARIKSGDTDDDLYNYLTSLPNGRLMKSNTIFLRDKSGEAYGAFCINFEISAFASFRTLLGNFIATEDPNDVSEMLSDNIHETIQSLISETLYDLGNGLPIISREDKVDFVARLDNKGIFQVKKAIPILADQLGLSRATVYNYLREARGERPSENNDNKNEHNK